MLENYDVKRLPRKNFVLCPANSLGVLGGGRVKEDEVKEEEKERKKRSNEKSSGGGIPS